VHAAEATDWIRDKSLVTVEVPLHDFVQPTLADLLSHYNIYAQVCVQLK
jgi:hypothetical protein